MWLAIIEVRSASFRLVLHAQHMFANSLIFSSPDRYQLQFSILCAYFVYTVRHCTGQHCSSVNACTYCLLAGTWRPLVSVITTLSYVGKITFHRRVWYHALSLCYVCIWSLGIIRIPCTGRQTSFMMISCNYVILTRDRYTVSECVGFNVPLDT